MCRCNTLPNAAVSPVPRIVLQKNTRFSVSLEHAGGFTFHHLMGALAVASPSCQLVRLSASPCDRLLLMWGRAVLSDESSRSDRTRPASGQARPCPQNIASQWAQVEAGRGFVLLLVHLSFF